MIMSTRALAKQCESTSRVLKALAHPRRLQVLCHLSQKPRTVTELEPLCAVSQSQLSQFLQRMKSERLVASRREGKFVFYEIQNPQVLRLIQSLHEIFCP